MNRTEQRDITAHIPYPVVNDGGAATHVLVPLADYLRIFDKEDIAPEGWTFVPNAVGRKVSDGISPLRAWREYLGLTQAVAAKLMGISRPAWTQMEKSEKPHRATLEKAAIAFGIDAAQLIELYDGEPANAPSGTEPA
jgi:DNA-binding XRE family transcriptional regulator